MAIHGAACLSVDPIVVELLYVVLVGCAITVSFMGWVPESAHLHYQGAPHLRCTPHLISASDGKDCLKSIAVSVGAFAYP